MILCRKKRITASIILVSCTAFLFAVSGWWQATLASTRLSDEESPLFAIIDFSVHADNLSSEGASVGQIPHGDIVQCRLALAGMISETLSVHGKITYSGCVSKLPDHLLGVNTGSALSDAYVVKIDDSGLGAPAWFIHKNMPKSMSSDDVCHNLLILISSLFPDAAHECRPPKNE
ncbi:hypothetical protein ACXDSS_004492 [Klebsiella quasipneumoniae]